MVLFIQKSIHRNVCGFELEVKDRPYIIAEFGQMMLDQAVDRDDRKKRENIKLPGPDGSELEMSHGREDQDRDQNSSCQKDADIGNIDEGIVGGMSNHPAVSMFRDIDSEQGQRILLKRAACEEQTVAYGLGADEPSEQRLEEERFSLDIGSGHSVTDRKAQRKAERGNIRRYQMQAESGKAALRDRGLPMSRIGGT